MGLNLFSRSAAEPTARRERVVLGEPNPERFDVIETRHTRDHVIATVRFPGCTTYEGRKVVVYRRDVFDRVLASGSMDPHFIERGDCPFARFAPTPEGLEAAVALCRVLEEA